MKLMEREMKSDAPEKSSSPCVVNMPRLEDDVCESVLHRKVRRKEFHLNLSAHAMSFFFWSDS